MRSQCSRSIRSHRRAFSTRWLRPKARPVRSNDNPATPHRRASPTWTKCSPCKRDTANTCTRPMPASCGIGMRRSGSGESKDDVQMKSPGISPRCRPVAPDRPAICALRLTRYCPPAATCDAHVPRHTAHRCRSPAVVAVMRDLKVSTECGAIHFGTRCCEVTRHWRGRCVPNAASASASSS